MKESKRITFEKKDKRRSPASEPQAPKPAETPTPIFLRNFDPRTRFHYEWTPPDNNLPDHPGPQCEP
jgi:hypothetical protein